MDRGNLQTEQRRGLFPSPRVGDEMGAGWPWALAAGLERGSGRRDERMWAPETEWDWKDPRPGTRAHGPGGETRSSGRLQRGGGTCQASTGSPQRRGDSDLWCGEGSGLGL